MGLTAEQIDDLVIAALRDLGRLKFQQIAQTIQEYQVLPRILKRDRVIFDSGRAIQRTIMHTTSGAARHAGLYEEDVVNIGDVLAQINIPWRHTYTNWGFEVREPMMDAGAAKIVDLVKVRRTDAMLSLAALLETAFWTKPETDADLETPYGVPYWVVKNVSEGFNGGDPSGFSAGAGGMATGAYPRWKNYTGSYAAVSKADLIVKMRKAHRRIRFRSPVDINDYRNGAGDRYRIYTNDTAIIALENLGEAQNENLGRDLASMDETMTFRKHPIIWVPELDSQTDDPIYMLDMSTYAPVILSGDNLRETGPQQAGNQHNVRVVFVDLTWNMLCLDRRRQCVLYKA